MSMEAFLPGGTVSLLAAEAMDHAKPYRENQGRDARLGRESRRNQKRTEAKHAKSPGRKRLDQPDRWVCTTISGQEDCEVADEAVSTREDLDHLLTQRRVGAYVGVDPTAPSLHIGHLVPFMALGWLYIHGYPATFLVMRLPP